MSNSVDIENSIKNRTRVILNVSRFVQNGNNIQYI